MYTGEKKISSEDTPKLEINLLTNLCLRIRLKIEFIEIKRNNLTLKTLIFPNLRAQGFSTDCEPGTSILTKKQSKDHCCRVWRKGLRHKSVRYMHTRETIGMHSNISEALDTKYRPDGHHFNPVSPCIFYILDICMNLISHKQSLIHGNMFLFLFFFNDIYQGPCTTLKIPVLAS